MKAIELYELRARLAELQKAESAAEDKAAAAWIIADAAESADAEEWATWEAASDTMHGITAEREALEELIDTLKAAEWAAANYISARLENGNSNTCAGVAFYEAEN